MSRRPQSPTQLLGGLLAVGLGLQVLGFLVAALNVPHLEVTPAGLIAEGDRGVLVLGLLVFGLGGAMSLVGVVGFGVLLGLRARAEDRSAQGTLTP
jgi:hypothetical protein